MIPNGNIASIHTNDIFLSVSLSLSLYLFLFVFLSFFGRL